MSGVCHILCDSIIYKMCQIKTSFIFFTLFRFVLIVQGWILGVSGFWPFVSSIKGFHILLCWLMSSYVCFNSLCACRVEVHQLICLINALFGFHVHTPTLKCFLFTTIWSVHTNRRLGYLFVLNACRRMPRDCPHMSEWQFYSNALFF